MPFNATKQSLLNLPRFTKRSIVIFFDALLCGLTVWLAFGLRLDQWGQIDENQWWAFIAALGFSLPLFISFGLYRAIFRFSGSIALAFMVRAFAIYACLYLCVFTVIGINGIPRSIGVIQPILLFIGVGGSRYFMRFLLDDINIHQWGNRHLRPIALIYGAGSAGRQLAASLSISKEIQVKGFVDDDESLQGNTINGILVHRSIDLHKLINRLDITDVLLAIPSVSQAHRNEIITSLNGCGVRVRTLPGILDLAAGRVKVSDLHELDMNDLLGRKVVPPDITLLEKNLRGKTVLVTGAGGSIGSELCRQIIKFLPNSLILIDSSEHALYLINEELKKLIAEQEFGILKMVPSDGIKTASTKYMSISCIPCLASVRDKDLMLKIFSSHQPDTVFHAAAYKHVPLVEQNPAEGIRNNVFGTLTCAQVSLEMGVTNFILVSTDKAVRPTNVMGASKRIAELVLQAMADIASKGDYLTNFSMVRFGNVLGSSGSVAPLFSAQIEAGGPITLTHSEVTRYFMTIPEAAQLVIQASAMAIGGDVFVLDMGEPVRIYDLAAKMVYLSGLLIKDEAHPYGDIEIKVTGLRPGEKLYEELLIGNNPEPTAHPKIMKAHEDFLSWADLQQELEKLKLSLDANDIEQIRNALKKLVSGYQPYGNGNNFT